jgi:hypothetical protein
LSNKRERQCATRNSFKKMNFPLAWPSDPYTWCTQVQFQDLPKISGQQLLQRFCIQNFGKQI